MFLNGGGDALEGGGNEALGGGVGAIDDGVWEAFDARLATSGAAY